MPKKINIKNKIKLYTKNKWHQDIVAAYNLYKRTKNPEAKKKIEDHYSGKEIIWEERGLIDYLKIEDKKINEIINDKFKKKLFEKIFDNYSISENLKKIFEKKEIKIGNLLNNYLSKKIKNKKKINFSDFSIIKEIIFVIT